MMPVTTTGNQLDTGTIVPTALPVQTPVRSGSVLSPGTILKLEHHVSGESTGTESIFGAPNFRHSLFGVYGVAQPNMVGLETTVEMIRLKTSTRDPLITWVNGREEPVIYIAGRPFVLRLLTQPFRNMDAFAGISGPRLELVEERLKEEILDEARLQNNMIQVHVEDKNTVRPCWLTASNVMTIKQVFDQSSSSLVYQRIPISRGQWPFDQFIDALLSLPCIKSTNDPLVFSCGMGVGRVTFAMIVAVIMRHACADSGLSSDQDVKEITDDDTLTLKALKCLEQAIHGTSSVQWIMERGRDKLDSLKQAIQGDYKVILDLGRVLEDGPRNKRLVDQIIDQCTFFVCVFVLIFTNTKSIGAGIINLREQILLYRLKGLDPNDNGSYLDMALGYLERYY